MPLSRGELTLESSPRSVSEARRWVASVCHELDRDDLVDSAQLGISELVTNALLHGEPPISVRIRGTHRHPRVEVLDRSLTPPAPNHHMTHDDELLSTFGRGLGMVALSSHAWGAELLEGAKMVWFEPAADEVDEPDLAGQVYDSLDAASGRRPKVSLEDGLPVGYVGVPVPVYVDWRRHFRDVSRELRLLSLAHESEYPVAKTISGLFTRFAQEIDRTHGIEEIEQAVKSGVATTDIQLVIDPRAPEVVVQLLDVLELADSFCRAERLLSLAATDQQRDFQRWFLGEIVRQAAGGAPVAWSGTQTVEPARVIAL